MPRRIIVAGGGFGGAYAARSLERTLRHTDAKITLIDRNNYFVFHPLLVEAGTGNLEPRHTVIAVRAFVKRAHFRMAEVTGVDTSTSSLAIRDANGEPAALSYDHLVLALGSVTRLPEVPGLREHGFQLKTLSDAVELRDHAIALLERADATDNSALRRALLHLVVVGGNFTGAEVAGEFDVFLKEAARGYESISRADCRVTLVELSDRILGALDPELSDYATRQMRARGIDVRLGTTVTAIGPDHVEIDGVLVPTHTVIWCAGISPSPVLSVTDLPTDRRGYLRCDPELRVEGYENLWGIGDCAVNPDPDGNAYPATAQHAVRQAEHVAENIARVLNGAPPTPHVFKTMGSLAALGCRTGVARVFGIKLSGFAAWFLWRTVYLFKMPGWGRRLGVSLDWALSLVFRRRDYVQLGVHGRPRRLVKPLEAPRSSPPDP